MSEQQSPDTVAIIGASLAGATAAKSLRELGFAGRIALVGSETELPYERPPLSKGLLAGSDERDSVFVDSAEWYEENDVELRLSTVAVALDPASHTLTLDDGSALAYDKLLITTGSAPRILTVPGADRSGVHYLRSLGDSEALHALIAGGHRRVVLIGSGWIGMEVAATARELGNEVTIIERGSVPLASAIGTELGEIFARLHREHGVTILSSTGVERIVGGEEGVTGVQLSDGTLIAADLVVAAIGATPNVELAVSAGLAVDNGILVDSALRTSDPDIFAAGDVANPMHPVLGERLRSEHWANAIGGGKAVARSILGLESSYDDIPYFFTDQFDLGMEFSGYIPLTRDAELVFRGDRDSREFVAFWVHDDRVVAGMNVNVWDVNEQVQSLIRGGKTVETGSLSDPEIDLDTLL
jgi:NADPH-dependent 2,4-dienoyl-CoA reductase/sulfur reductase-like enzyme